MVTEAPYTVYALIDPETYDVRYIGKSSSMLKRPRQKHSAHCASWMKSLEKRNLEPIVRILSFEDDHEECKKDEIYWIAKFRKIGFDLTNIMDGGEGCSPGFKQSKETIEKRAAKLRGRKRDASVGRKISLAKKKEKIATICKQCSITYYVNKSCIGKTRFCSKKCQAAAKSIFMKNRIVSEETRNRARISALARWNKSN